MDELSFLLDLMENILGNPWIFFPTVKVGMHLSAAAIKKSLTLSVQMSTRKLSFCFQNTRDTQGFQKSFGQLLLTFIMVLLLVVLFARVGLSGDFATEMINY